MAFGVVSVRSFAKNTQFFKTFFYQFILMPSESSIPKQRLLKFAEYLSACTPEVTLYGRCVADKAERISHNACSKEFDALIKCFKKQVKRAKHSRRVMSFYKFKYGFQPPFNVLIDGTFCQAALKNQINIQEQVTKYLIEPTVLVTTKCVLKELEKIGKDVYGAFLICKQFKIAKCPHTPVRSAAECLSHLARRSKKSENSKYIIATQDDALLEQCRKIAGIPLMSIRFKTLILESPSEESVKETDQAAEEIEKVQAMKKEILGEPEAPKKKKKKGPKRPNPLSMKKKQKTVVGALKKDNGEKKKARRKKKRIILKNL